MSLLVNSSGVSKREPGTIDVGLSIGKSGKSTPVQLSWIGEDGRWVNVQLPHSLSGDSDLERLTWASANEVAKRPGAQMRFRLSIVALAAMVEAWATTHHVSIEDVLEDVKKLVS